ncbi:MAG TPA: nicotinamide riboside transporter PnuC [Flavobacteriales bacterium]|jgi:nicotinamide mononucleotide transporter|nr:nicotinamide riboside transporter PnuC [Flavobacteriales bacterium]HIK67067.1 nicotinamide riboside transporter PnuC [Flavobacteriales bacterium]
MFKNKARLIEIAAVTFSVAYTWMYLKGYLPWAFIPAALGAGLFAYICWNKKIYAESALQVFYIGLAGLGLIGYGNDVQISGLFHLILLSGAVIGTVVLGVILRKTTDAMLPFLDAFTTVFSLAATWLMINMIHENWLYWIVIDTVSIYLYAKRGLKLSSVLFLLYLLLALDGYFEAISIF